MKKHLPTVLLIFVFFLGFSILLYPTAADYINSRNQTRIIASYEEKVTKLEEEDYSSILEEARRYNEKIANGGIRFRNSDEMSEEYSSLLNVDGNGVMGYIQIDKIKVSLPIYHGASEEVLNVGVGHLEGSSLPVGGPNTHTVVSGHRGLPSAKLFTDLDQITEGDTFSLHVLKETLIYEVDQIRIVEPSQVKDLKIEAGKDYCTLVTCTPYGINTHRILVRGHRIETPYSFDGTIEREAIQLDRLQVASVMAVPVLLILLLILLLRHRKK